MGRTLSAISLTTIRKNSKTKSDIQQQMSEMQHFCNLRQSLFSILFSSSFSPKFGLLIKVQNVRTTICLVQHANTKIKSSPPLHEHTQTILVNNPIHPTLVYARRNMRSKADLEDRREKKSVACHFHLFQQLATSCSMSNTFYTMKFQSIRVTQC